jgi:tetratricopeptide (TPR) repeat protein
LLIGWDAADWQLIRPLVDQGLMPTTAALVREGTWGNLATIRPILSPMLWNTIATGKRPRHHGVYGFTEPSPDGTGVRPVASTSRKCKALWNILTQCGLRSNVVGWYASHPAEPINGVMVSNQFEHCAAAEGQFLPLPPGAIHPGERAAELAGFRVHPAEIDGMAILPFVPTAAQEVQRTGHRLGKVQQLLAQTSTIHAVATHLMANTNWDLTAVYYEGIDRCGHEFMQFHPPKMEEVSQQDFDAYQHCMVGIYRFHDMLLETLLAIAGDDTTVILMSDHGYYSNHLRPDPREGKSGPVDWHRPFGIFAGRGPGFRAGTQLYGASILDIAPTVLELLGLPPAHDMPGRVLAEVLVDADRSKRIESWEEIDGATGMHPAELRIDPAESRAVMQQLADLGYINPPSKDAEKAIRDTMASNQVNLIYSLADGRDYPSAIEVIEQLDDPPRSTAAVQLLLAFCLLGINENSRARAILDQLIAEGCDEPRLHMMLGALEFADGNSQQALQHLNRVGDAEARLPGLQNRLGEVYLGTKQYALAIAAFEKALAIDGESPLAFAGLARAKLELGDPQAALDHALVAVELVHHFPRVHYVIGKALVALGDYQGAVEALELCVKQAPRMSVAHNTLARAYRNLGQSDKAMASDLRAKGTLA